MSTQAYAEWLALGKPYELCQPGKDLLVVLKRAGYDCGSYPDLRHLTKDRPEDHTPFSYTGWPVASKRWVGHAIDVMPTKGLPHLANLARRLIADKNAKVKGTGPIKYINWTSVDGVCRHESWQPDHRTTSSTDAGHLHISFRSDMDLSKEIYLAGYNPTEVAMADSVGETAEHWRTLAWLMLNPELANRPEIVEGARLASVPAIEAMLEIRANLRELVGRPPIEPVSIDNLAAALVSALANKPEVVDALATAVAAQVGMIPTAQQIARYVGELSWHGRIEG